MLTTEGFPNFQMDHQQIKTLKKRKKILQLHHRIALKQEKKGMHFMEIHFCLKS